MGIETTSTTLAEAERKAQDHVDSPANYIGPDSTNHMAKLEVPDVTWYKDAGLRKLYFMMPILMLCATVNGYDGSLLNGLQTMQTWQDYFNNPNGSTLGLFTAIVNIGAFAALFFAPYIADLFGRKIGIAIGLVILIVGAIIQVVPSVNKGMFIGGRFLVGFGSNISQGSAPLLITELAHPQHRGKLTTMFNTLWYLGSIIAAWTVYGTIKYQGSASWRIPVGLQALMPAIQLAGVWLLPESPRWLCSKDRRDEAFDILVKVCSDPSIYPFPRSLGHPSTYSSIHLPP